MSLPDEVIEFVKRAAADYRGFINGEPGLLSLLYDIDLLPEQLLHVLQHNPKAAPPNAARMIAMCELWKARDIAKWNGRGLK